MTLPSQHAITLCEQRDSHSPGKKLSERWEHVGERLFAKTSWIKVGDGVIQIWAAVNRHSNAEKRRSAKLENKLITSNICASPMKC